MDKTDLTYISLNVRGIRGNQKRNSLFQWLNSQHMDIILLQETYFTKEMEYRVQNEWKGKCFHSYGTNHSRGVSILIKQNLDVNVESSIVTQDGRNVMLLLSVDDRNICIINVYAPTEKPQKEKYFKFLLNWINSNKKKNFSELIIGGDFNCVLNPRLDTSGTKSLYTTPIGLKNIINALNLIDVWRNMHKDSLKFTYRNERLKMASRIDMWLVNSDACQYVNKTSIKPVAICPDHFAITLEMRFNDIKRGPGYWKFNNSLLTDDFYRLKIKNILHCAKQNLEKGDDVVYVWELCKIKIKEFSMTYAKQKKDCERREITLLQNKYAELLLNFEDLDEEKRKETATIKSKINEFYNQQCEGAKIRSRVAWFEEGEKNCKYFLNLEKSNGLKKSLTSVKVGKRIETNGKKILKQVHKFYSRLYESVNIGDDVIDEYLESIQNTTLTDDDANLCEGDINENELTLALKNMKLNKAPGADGLTTEFYREFWNDIKIILVKNFNESFHKGKLGYSQRKGIITLIFKNGEKENLQNWRPITLLNIDYKLIATVLANRLQKVLKQLINEDQVGYVKGRRGTDIARLIQDVIDFSNTQSLECCLLFVDFHKAFDTLEWNFIQKCLGAYGFKVGFMKWVSLLYTDICNSVSLNGWLTDSIVPSRGIRQGCPLSALLFVLAIEMIAIKVRDTQSIEGISIGNVNKELKIAQLADDMTLFCRNTESAQNALQMIADFGEKAGIKLNKDKTTALWLGPGNPSETILDIPWADNFVKSLGICFSKRARV